MSKCLFAPKQVEYLGHIISGKGISTDPSKIKAMQNCPTPVNVKQLRGFHGLTRYYMRFIRNYVIISKSLTTLLKKNSFAWNSSIKKLIKKVVAECDVYQRNKSDLAAFPGYLQPLPIPTKTDGQTKVVNKCMECFMRYMTGEKPKEWVKWVSLAEYCTIFGEEMDRAISMLQFHLKRSRERIKNMTDKNRSDRNFEVAYKLQLPENSQIHHVFHVSQLKLCKGTNHQVGSLLEYGRDGVLINNQSADFIVVDYEVNSLVPLILGRPFLRTAHALIDVHGEELILRDDDERLIFKPNVFHPTSGIPTPTFEPLIEFFSPSPTPSEGSDLLLGETDTLIRSYDNSWLELESFCFEMEEKSNGSPTSLSVISLPIYEAFSFENHTKEKSSGSTTTHSYLSLLVYDSFRFDLTGDHILPTKRSDFLSEEFTYELSHIISLPEYDSFHFGNEDIVISLSGSPTHSSDSTIGFPSQSLTSFKDIDLLLEETDTFLDSIPLYIDDGICDSEGDILFLDNSLKDEPSEIEESNPKTPNSVDLLLIGESSLIKEAFKNDSCPSFPSENEDKVFNPGIPC
ncbi:hypothetical protein Tco_0586035 [Tanacetum coccineum]